MNKMVFAPIGMPAHPHVGRYSSGQPFETQLIICDTSRAYQVPVDLLGSKRTSEGTSTQDGV